MKTKMATMLAIAAIVASCSKEEVVSVGAESSGYNTIGFSTYSTLNATKGAPITQNSDFTVENQTFDVKAFLTLGSNTYSYLEATIVCDDETNWDYQTSSDAKYWPSDTSQTLDFYAYTNKGSNTVTIASSGIASTYTVPATIADQGDFMLANTLDAANEAANTDVTDGTVTLEFEHALTQINVTAEVAADYTLVIDDVSFYNIYSTGTLAYPLASTAAATDRIWGGQATTATYSISPTSSVTITYEDGAKAFDDDTESGGSDAGYELILLPQTFSAWNATSKASEQAGAYISVTCTLYKALSRDVNGTDTSMSEDKVYYIGSSSTPATIAIPLASITDNTANYPEWIAGRNITYNLSFSAEGTENTGGYDPETGDEILVPIAFSTDVVDWDVYDSNSTDTGDQSADVTM